MCHSEYAVVLKNFCLSFLYLLLLIDSDFIFSYQLNNKEDNYFNFIYFFTGYAYKIIDLNRRKMILYKNYTFSQHTQKSNNFYCSKRTTLSCKAKINLDKTWNIRQVVSEHNHPPPVLYLTPSGKYVKVDK